MTWIFSSLMLIVIVSNLYLIWRTVKVHKFRTYILDLCYEHNIRHIPTKEYIWLDSKHTYSEMVYSFKPLKLESWFTKEEIERIKR